MLCSAGGKGSYMSLIPLAGSLMLDFHCHVLPRHVYAITDQFEEDRIIDSELQERITLLASDICWLSKALAER
jgi:FMN reductase